MATVTVQMCKDHMSIIHTAHDARILQIIGQAEQWAEHYTGVNSADVSASSSSETIDESYQLGVIILVQMIYEGKITDYETFEKAAKTILFPSRTNLGF